MAWSNTKFDVSSLVFLSYGSLAIPFRFPSIGLAIISLMDLSIWLLGTFLMGFPRNLLFDSSLDTSVCEFRRFFRQWN